MSGFNVPCGKQILMNICTFCLVTFKDRWKTTDFKAKLDGVPVPERIKTATRQMIISNFR